MATYQGIHGRPIRAVSSDLSGAAAEGEVWYNTASNVLKVMYPFTGWATADALVTASRGGGTCGTATLALYAGGTTGPAGISGADKTEEYDGTSWATAPATLTQRRTEGCMFGIQTSAVIYGGRINDGNPGPTYTTIATEEYDGTSWSAGGNYPLIVTTSGGAGVLTAGLGATGYTTPGDPGTDTPVSAEYNGTSWTAGNPVLTARRDVNVGPQGTQTAALLIDGRVATTHQSVTEEYDGTSWATAGSTTATQRCAMVFGTQTSALSGFGTQGGPVPSVVCNTYDGTSWSVAPSGGTARYFIGGAGTSSTTGLAMGGAILSPAPGRVALVEEFSSGGVEVKTISTS